MNGMDADQVKRMTASRNWRNYETNCLAGQGRITKRTVSPARLDYETNSPARKGANKICETACFHGDVRILRNEMAENHLRARSLAANYETNSPFDGTNYFAFCSPF
jgi:hypothetical protein